MSGGATSSNTGIEIPPVVTEIPPIVSDGEPVPPPVYEDIKLYIAVGVKRYGPYNMEQCQQLVEGGQLTQRSKVWKEGMASWAPASEVEELQPLFAPPAIPGMPPLPPTDGSTPPPLV